MRPYLIGFVLGLLLSGGIIIYKYFNDKPEKEIVYTVVENIRKVDSLEFTIALKDSSIVKQENEISNSKLVIKKQRKEIIVYTDIADSLEQAYLNDKSIERCDSTLNAKNVLLAEKDTLINDLDNEAQKYSDNIVTLKSKINDQHQLIKEKDVTIQNLSCAMEWKINHKFIAWILGWKCKQPPTKNKL